MLSRLVLKNIKPQCFQTISTFPRVSFSNTDISDWRPNVPKHELQLDGTSYCMVHPLWDKQDIVHIEQTHYEPKTVGDRFALYSVKFIRKIFDTVTLYQYGKLTEKRYLRRFLAHSVLAAVPGMIGAMARHCKSLSTMKKENGWVHHLLEEAENQRVHFFTFMDVTKPNVLVRLGFLGVQAIFIAYYALMYATFPRVAHRFVGYMKEESIKTYSNALKDIEEGKLKAFEEMAAPKVAGRYWKLSEDAKFKHVLQMIRADEIMHREVNHHFGDISPDAEIKQFGKIVVIPTDTKK